MSQDIAPGVAASFGPLRPTLEVERLTVSYRSRQQSRRVLEDVSLAIRPGEAYGLVGESGCGKTTLAMAVMRYLAPNSEIEAGRILFQGDQDLLAANDTALRSLRGNRIAMVYQDPASALNPSIRVGEQIAEVYRQHRGMAKGAARAAALDILNAVQFSDPGRVMRRYAHELSGGQQQRVVIAMAIATNPDLLILDEPTTGLDATVEAEVLDLVEQLRAKWRAAILFISHNLAIVSRVCERVGILYAGRLVEEGPTAEVFSSPRHPYTAALLQCVPRHGMRKHTEALCSIPGTIPEFGGLLRGCVFAPRCAIAEPVCAAEMPALATLTAGRNCRCFFPLSAATPMRVEGPGRTAVSASRDEMLASRQDLLEVADLRKIYGPGRGGVVALDSISLLVKRGEVLGIVGESGSGKSSLAKCIVGFVEPSEGRIRLDDIVLTKASRRDSRVRQKMQMVFQNPDTALNPSHTVERILSRAILQLNRGISRSGVHSRLRALVDAVRLDSSHLARLPSALSGGQRQRVAIARAFAGSPELVLCDEPTSALDVSVQASILNLLSDLQVQQHVSYVFISHDLSVVRYLADRIAVMYLGQIVEIGPWSTVLAPPHHPYTEALLSATTSLGTTGGGRGRIKLAGALPNPADLPSGCRFHPRCPRFLGQICRDQEPPLQRAQDGHAYRCHISPETLAALQTCP